MHLSLSLCVFLAAVICMAAAAAVVKDNPSLMSSEVVEVSDRACRDRLMVQSCQLVLIAQGCNLPLIRDFCLATCGLCCGDSNLNLCGWVSTLGLCAVSNNKCRLTCGAC